MNIDVLKEKKEKILLQILLFIIVVILLFLNLETIYAYDNDDWFGIFVFFVYQYNTVTVLSIILILICLYSIIGNASVTYVVLSIFTIAFGVASRVFRNARGEFLTTREIINYKEAMGLEHSYSGIINPYLVIIVLLNLLLVFGVVKAEYKDLNKYISWKSILKRSAVVLATVGIYFAIYIFGFKNSYITMLLNNYSVGAFFTLNESFFEKYYSNIAYDKVEEIKEEYNYSISETFHDIVSENNIRTPNIIVIMSEAYWDTNNFIDNIRMDPDPMKKYYDLVEDSISGKCAVDIFGGGTNVSEWEFNTGCSNGNPYGTILSWRDFERNSYETMITYFERLGYSSLALHGYDGTFYSRIHVYPNMGFDRFYEFNDFHNKELYNGYISDESLTKEIIYRFEEQKKKDDKPVYLFTVSIQNHVKNMIDKLDDSNDNTGYVSVNYKNIDIPNEYKRKILKYANGIYLTNEALGDLIQYFKNYDEDTMIIFFGDHAPEFLGLETDIYNNIEKYKTPYLVWTNYNNEYKEIGDINLSYLSTEILDCLKFPDTLLTKKNKYLLGKYRINTLFESDANSLDETGKTEYLNDMLNEKIIYSYEGDMDEKNRYLWN